MVHMRCKPDSRQELGSKERIEWPKPMRSRKSEAGNWRCAARRKNCVERIRNWIPRKAKGSKARPRRGKSHETAKRDGGSQLQGRGIGRGMVRFPNRRVPAARGALTQQGQAGMQVVAQRDGKEEQHQRANDSGPFANRIAAPRALLPHPAGAPGAQCSQRDERPKKIKKCFH